MRRLAEGKGDGGSGGEGGTEGQKTEACERGGWGVYKEREVEY